MKAMIVERVSNADNTGYALRAGINRPYQAKISTAGRYTFAGHLKITVSNLSLVYLLGVRPVSL
jgi:hypothetical protein